MREDTKALAAIPTAIKMANLLSINQCSATNTAMKFVILAFIAAAVVAGVLSDREKIKYQGYKVYRVRFQNDKQFALLERLQNDASGIELWQVNRLEKFADVLIPPSGAATFMRDLDAYGFRYSLQIADVQSLINNEQAY